MLSFTRQLEQIAHSGVATFEKLLAAARTRRLMRLPSAAEGSTHGRARSSAWQLQEIGREWYLSRRAAADLELAEYTGALFEGTAPTKFQSGCESCSAVCSKDEGPVKAQEPIENLADRQIYWTPSCIHLGDKTLPPAIRPLVPAAIECSFCIMLASRALSTQVS